MQQNRTGLFRFIFIKSKYKKSVEKDTPFGPYIYVLQISRMKGEVKFRSIRENGERGTPELRGINLKLLSFSFSVFYYYS